MGAIDRIARVMAWFINVGLFPLSIYRAIDFKGKLLISGHVKRFPPNGVYRCRGLLFDLDFADGLQQAIYLNLFERPETEMIKRLIKPGDVIVDVGANVGYYSVHLSSLVGESGFVHAFEPDPKNYFRLVRNLQLNGFEKRSRANQMAVSSSSGTAQFILTPAQDSGWGHVAEGAPAAGEQTVQVHTTKLDDYLQSQDVRSVSFLKCDIEGHEFDFLAGATRTLEARAIGKVLIEYNGFNLNPRGRSVAEFVELFERCGYRPIEINLDRVEKSRQQRVVSDRDTYNLLFEKIG